MGILRYCMVSVLAQEMRLYFLILFMKYAILFIISIIFGYTWSMVYPSVCTDPPSGYGVSRLPYTKMAIGCHNEYPMSEEYINSIVRPCTSTRSPHQVQWAWFKWKDMDFILTVDAESRWDHQSVWDSGRAFGYCQIRWDFNKWWYDRYKAMETWQERLTECHRMYTEWKQKGIVANRLYGYRVRHLNKSLIKCYE